MMSIRRNKNRKATNRSSSSMPQNEIKSTSNEEGEISEDKENDLSEEMENQEFKTSLINLENILSFPLGDKESENNDPHCCAIIAFHKTLTSQVDMLKAMSASQENPFSYNGVVSFPLWDCLLSTLTAKVNQIRKWKPELDAEDHSPSKVREGNRVDKVKKMTTLVVTNVYDTPNLTKITLIFLVENILSFPLGDRESEKNDHAARPSAGGLAGF